jgi:hypothetical protein
MPPTVEQNVAVGEEVRTSIKLIEAGLGQLQRIDGANDFYHLPMLLLASGFERLMKSIICFHTLHETGEYPGRNAFLRGRAGHDLARLLNKITKECFSEAYLKRVPVARQDIEYLRTDKRLLELVRILSDFGQAARYYHLDVVLGDNPTTSSPEQQWQQVEMAILREDNDWADQLKPPVNMDKVYKRITNDLVVRLEVFARALTRLFTIGGLGDEAKRHTGTIAPFLHLCDDELGKRAYK